MRCIDMHYIDKNKVTCLRKQCQNLVHMYTVRMQYLVNNVAKGGKHSPLNYNEFSLLCYLNPNLMFVFFYCFFLNPHQKTAVYIQCICRLSKRLM